MIYNIKQVPVFKERGELNVTCPFGDRINPVTGKEQFHNGVDCTRWTGGSDIATIVAIEDGEIVGVETSVKTRDNNKISGNYVRIIHNEEYVSCYCHLAYGTIPNNIRLGSRVTKGQVLGTMGETGRATGIHLHFGVSRDGTYIDPLPYLLEQKKIPTNTEKMTTVELPVIRNGSKNDSVAVVQTVLNMLGYRDAKGNVLAVDGEFGKNTEYAVRMFQTIFGLKSDGIVGKNTWSKLLT